MTLGDAMLNPSATYADAAAESDHREQLLHVWRAVQALPDGVRTVVTLVLTEGLTHSELAERLAIPLGTVKTRMRSGIQQLRASLRHYFPERLA